MTLHAGNNSTFKYRVAILGAPSRPDVPWTIENVKKLKDLGFNAIQINIAWGGRPMDEALNIEDVVCLSPERMKELNQPELPLRSVPERREERRQELHDRLRIASGLGMRTLFHFGAPYNSQYGGINFEGPQARSLLDPETTMYYQELLGVFAGEYKEVDDILVYTFDQDAWLASEFGSCAKTRGVPLHERVVPFVEALAKTWRSFRPDGWLWWSPWELSGGQLFQCLENISPEGIGIDLHSSVGEVIASMPVDRWMKNATQLAAGRGMPVMCESFLGAVCEETEPFQDLAHPPLVIRQVQAIAAVPGVVALKEYYGLVPVKPDPNLQAASLSMMNPDMPEAEILRQIAGDCEELVEFWELAARAHELFPWDVSWWIRCIGLVDVSHDLNAATIRGRSVPTPSWCSTRAATFMKTDDTPPHPWMLEDIQLRCESAVQTLERAVAVGQKTVPAATLRETEMLKEKILAYVCHLRESNLAKVMRDFVADGLDIPGRVLDEMEQVLVADIENQQAALSRIPLPLDGAFWIWADGKGSDEWLPFEPCRFSYGFRVGSGLREALFCCASSENLVRVEVNGTRVEEFGTGIPPYTTSLNLQEGINRLDVTVVRAGSLYTREAFCARMALSYEDGREEMLDTGRDWQADGQPVEIIAPFNLERYIHREWSYERPPSLAFTGNCRQGDGGVATRRALELLRSNLPAFMEEYFLPVEDHRSRGHFSVTSC